MTVQTTSTHALIIPHYNDLERLDRCLTEVTRQLGDLEASPAVDVMVVDNASPVSLSDIQAKFPEIGFATEPRKGAAMARNRGVDETNAPGLIFLDADCVPLPGWLSHAVSIEAEDQVVGGRMDIFHETPPPRSGAEAFEAVFAFKQRDYIEKKGFSVTANLVTTRSVFERTGPMSTGLSEDVDWCKRAVAAGAKLRYDDALAVSHPSRQDYAGLAKKWRRVTEEMFGLTGGGASARLKWGLRGSAMPLSALAHLPKVIFAPELSMIEKWRATLTLFRLRFARMGWMMRQAVQSGPQKD